MKIKWKWEDNEWVAVLNSLRITITPFPLDYDPYSDKLMFNVCCEYIVKTDYREEIFGTVSEAKRFAKLLFENGINYKRYSDLGYV